MRLVRIAILGIVLFLCRNAFAIDLNGDGMSDVWQQIYNVPSSDANLDYNGVGLTNIQKSLLGLDPRAPNTRFFVQQIPNFPSNEITIRLNTVYAKNYQIETASPLSTSWTSSVA